MRERPLFAAATAAAAAAAALRHGIRLPCCCRLGILLCSKLAELFLGLLNHTRLLLFVCVVVRNAAAFA